MSVQRINPGCDFCLNEECTIGTDYVHESTFDELSDKLTEMGAGCPNVMFALFAQTYPLTLANGGHLTRSRRFKPNDAEIFSAGSDCSFYLLPQDVESWELAEQVDGDWTQDATPAVKITLVSGLRIEVMFSQNRP